MAWLWNMKGVLLMFLCMQIRRSLSSNATNCTDNTLSPGPGRCTFYYKCVQGSYSLQACPIGQLFDPIQGQCDWFWSVKCDRQCEPGRKYRSASNCTDYYDCVDGLFRKSSCNRTEGLGFNGRECSRNFSCPLEANFPTAIPCRIENQITPGSRCSSYNECVGSFQKERTCPMGLRFNARTLRCDWMWTVECGRQCSDNTLYADSKDCRVYYTCSSGAFIKHDCGSDSGFNGTGCSTTYDCPVRRLPVASRCAVNGEKSQVNGSCTSYKECVDGFEKEDSCVIGRRFNPNKRQCDWFWNVDCNAQYTETSNSINTQ